MTTWIGLLRGINVGGKNLLPMASLKKSLETLNCTNVSTYIQSGNLVFESRAKSASTLSRKIANRIEEEHGFRPHVFLLTCEELEAAVVANPFPDATADPKSLHFCFLDHPPTAPDREALEQIRTSTEQFEWTDQVFYLHAPDGIGRSKLAASIEKHLGVTATSRNYRTIAKLCSLTNIAEQT